jgi:hypothetical protein
MPPIAPALANNRIGFARRLIARFRQEKNPPFARYGIVLSVAEYGDQGATAAQLAKAMGDPIIGGSLDKIEHSGFIRRIHGTRPLRFVLTDTGTRLVKDLTA